MDRQLYPDFLRTMSIVRIIVFHFIGWQFLTYIPSLGIMFALGGWFMAVSLNNGQAMDVVFKRLVRLLPTWWAFALLTFVGGFFYAQGAKISLQTTLAWLFPYQQVTWNLDNPYANDAVVVTWYIAAYLWLMLLSPFLLLLYKKLPWVSVYIPVFAMLIYYYFFPGYQQTVLGETFFNVLTFSGCWILGFSKADGTINSIPKYLIYLTTIVCSACGIFLTYKEGALSSNPIALSLMSFGIAMLLLSFNPNLSFLSKFPKGVIRTINTYAVTIYLFHNILIDVSFKFGDYIHAYDIAQYIKLPDHSGTTGNLVCFIILIGLIYISVKTIGIVETHKWLPNRKISP